MSAARESGGLAPDYAAARARLAHRYRAPGVLAIDGPDRLAFLQGQLTQDVRSLSAGQSLPTAGLSPKGKLLYFGRVVALPDRLLLLTDNASRNAVAAHLAKYAAFQKAGVQDVSEEFLGLGLYGPGTASIEAPRGALALPAEGEFSAGILAPASHLAELDRLLAQAGSIAVSPETAETLRIEAGRPRFGQDADGSNLPDEVGLQSAVSTAKGCYVGQEVVARLRTYGRVAKRLVGFRFPEAPVPAGTVYANPEKPGHELARITSCAASPRFGAIGLGLAFREVPEGSTLIVAGEPDSIAVVGPLPFA